MEQTAGGIALQLAILFLALASFLVINYFPNKHLNKVRTKNRASLQSNRHYILGTHSLARAKSTPNNANSQSLAKTALAEAESAIVLSPRDPAPLILKALALDLLGHRITALKSLDSALSPPRVKLLSGKERGDALVKRAELKLAVNRRRRVDSAVQDLKEAIRVMGIEEDGKTAAFCLLGQCYEWRDLKDEAQWAFEQAIKIQPGSTAAREGLNRLAHEFD